MSTKAIAKAKTLNTRDFLINALIFLSVIIVFPFSNVDVNAMQR
ncbi:hypothetical protein HMPREF1320_1982 [Capnocytophaga sp. oral taxon 335 str. F0486]|nr:hypothetical protein HMPREF1320_1982 [Capnocytophaga sp. oral taxon 335 str. F0486]